MEFIWFMDHAGAKCPKVTHAIQYNIVFGCLRERRLNVNKTKSPCLLFRARARHHNPLQVCSFRHVVRCFHFSEYSANLAVLFVATKSKKSKKKKTGSKTKNSEDVPTVNGTKTEPEGEVDDGEGDEPGTPTVINTWTVCGRHLLTAHTLQRGTTNGISNAENLSSDLNAHTTTTSHEIRTADEGPTSHSQSQDTSELSPLPNGTSLRPGDHATFSDTEERIEAYARDRDLLREEVAELRRSLEEIQVKHEHELETVRQQLEETQGQKDHSDTQYRNLLGKVNGIKAQLGERLKADAVWQGLMHTRLK